MRGEESNYLCSDRKFGDPLERVSKRPWLQNTLETVLILETDDAVNICCVVLLLIAKNEWC